MDTIGTVKEVLIENKKMMEKIDATLDANQDRVEKTINFTRKCEEAMEFGDISKMTICYRHLAKRKQQS